MWKYLLKRVIVMIPTFFGITIVCFFIINLTPGGPIEQKISQLQFHQGGSGDRPSATASQEVIQNLKKQYGFDKPIYIRYGLWIKNIITFNFGDSFFYDQPVIDVISSRIPISLQFGIISFILTYLICIILGIIKAVYANGRFDFISSIILLIMYSMPVLVLGILLKTYLTGGGFLDWFPVGDLYSDQYFDKGLMGKIGDRIHHFILPLICYMMGTFTVLTFLVKNALLDEVQLDYVRTAKAKGLSAHIILYKHVLRNALIPIVTGIGAFIGIFMVGNFIIETIFNIDGMGLLAYNSALRRDYNVMMALIFFFSITSLLGRLFSDFMYVLVDPRLDFS